MSVFTYIPKGVCSRGISIELDGDVIDSVAFEGGCNGNLQAISRLVKGQTVDEVVATLQGLRCGMKQTSCPDQLTKALQDARATSSL